MAAIRVRRLERYRQVVAVLGKYGFGYLVERMDPERVTPVRRALRKLHHEEHSEAQHLRLACEELGGTFIKLGQILSTRTDLLPPDYARELAKLQDAVPPEPPGVIEAVIEQELGRPVQEVFATFDPQPLGSGSLGQVHAATLKDGRAVVVKVQRPGIEHLVEEDIAILTDLAHLAGGRTEFGRIYDLPGMVVEFAEVLRGELDYEREADNAERIRRNFAGDRSLRVPRVYRALSTRRVLTMDRLEGIKIGNLEALDQAGIDRGEVARAWSRCLLKMMLEDGFYQADPHPGNFLVGADNTIGLVDYGMVGRLDRRTRSVLLLMFLAIIDEDIDRVIDRLVDLGVVAGTFQLAALRRDLAHLLTRYYGMALKDVNVGETFEELMEVVRRHRLQMPTTLALFGKTISMQDGLVRQLDPEFNLAEALGPRVREMALEVHSPREVVATALTVAGDLGRLSASLPRRLDRLSAQAEQGTLSVNIKIQDADYYIDYLNAMTNRLIIALMAAAMIVGLAVLLWVYKPSGWEGLAAAMFVVGIMTAAALGTTTLVSVCRRRRLK